MSPLATLFRAILHGLQATIAKIAAKNRQSVPLLLRVSNHLHRTIQRFERLFTLWQRDALPAPRPGAASPRAPRKTPSAPSPRLPSGKAWLTRALASTEANARASQLQHFLALPDCAAFLAQVPRAARLLRPLADALGLHLPCDPPPPDPKPSFTPDHTPLPPAIGIVITRLPRLNPKFPKPA